VTFCVLGSNDAVTPGLAVTAFDRADDAAGPAVERRVAGTVTV